MAPRDSKCSSTSKPNLVLGVPSKTRASPSKKRSSRSLDRHDETELCIETSTSHASAGLHDHDYMFPVEGLRVSHMPMSHAIAKITKTILVQGLGLWQCQLGFRASKCHVPDACITTILETRQMTSFIPLTFSAVMRLYSGRRQTCQCLWAPYCSSLTCC